MKRLYTEVSADSVMKLRSLASALFDAALADNLPLQRLVEANVTQEVLDAIAEQSRKGRMLLIGTTDLDAQRSVCWNLTLMAESRHPQALPLIRKILVASAATPDSFARELPEAFDRDDMNELFQVGYRLGAGGCSWATHPPGLVAGDAD